MVIIRGIEDWITTMSSNFNSEDLCNALNLGYINTVVLKETCR